jgi:hypothetical protein
MLAGTATGAAEPAAEDFKRALDAHLLQQAGAYLPRPCVRVGFHLGAPERAFPGTEFDWTPASFVSRHDADSPKVGNPEGPYQLLARHGLMQARTLADGAREYTMTWKGFGASDGQGCFFTGGGTVDTVVHSFEKARGEGGREIWRVAATGRPKEIEPWAGDAEYPQHFNSYSNSRTELYRRTYEIERAGRGYAVVRKPGPEYEAAMKNPVIRAWQEARERKRQDPAKVAQAAGPLSAERILAALQAYMKEAYAPPNRVCFPLPHMSDESNLGGMHGVPGDKRPAPVFTLYNLEWRPGGPTDLMRNFDILSRFQSAGLAGMARVPATEYRGGKANGALRFELTPAGVAMLAPEDPLCLLVGHVEVVEVVGFQQFDAATLLPRFAARTRFKPLPGREALIARFGNFARLQEAGGAMTGHVAYGNGPLVAREGVFKNPQYRADRAQLAPPPFN